MKYIFALFLFFSTGLGSQAADLFLFAGQSNATRMDSPAFIAEYQNLTGKTPVVINCGVNGTYMGEWLIEYHAANRSLTYTSCRQKAYESIAQGNELKGVIWWQGESDSFTGSYRDAAKGWVFPIDWVYAMKTLTEKFRQDLRSPNLPFIIFKMAPYQSAACVPPHTTEFLFNTMRLQQEYAVKNIDNTALVDLSDTYTNCQSFHHDLTTGAYQDFARRAANKFVEKFGNL